MYGSKISKLLKCIGAALLDQTVLGESQLIEPT